MVYLMMNKKKLYSLNQCALYKCSSKKKLVGLLQTDLNILRNISNITKYKSFQLDKKGSSEKRTITAPQNEIKKLQSKVYRLLQKVSRPDWLISSQLGKSYISNGEKHLTSKYLLTVDIKHFYDNCSREYVYNFFRFHLLTPPDIAKILTDIVTFEGGIPTGCPTSQVIAYYAYEEMFVEIFNTASKYGCTFSVYVDDMSFSSSDPFDCKNLTREIDVTLRKYNHLPKYKKIKYYKDNIAKPITGTIVSVDNDLKVPNQLQHKIIKDFTELQIMMKNDVIASNEKEKQQLINKLRGRLQAAKNIDSKIFPEINRYVQSIAKL